MMRERIIYYVNRTAFLGAITPFTRFMVLKYRRKKDEINFNV